MNESFNRLGNLTPGLIAHIRHEFKRYGKMLTDSAINQVIDIPVNRVKWVVRMNITMPIKNFRGRIKRTVTSGVHKAKAFRKVITGKMGGVLPILPMITFLAPFVMSGATNFSIKKLKKR